MTWLDFKPGNLASLSVITVTVLWVHGCHFEQRSGISCTEIKEDQKITNALHLGLHQRMK